MPGRVFAADSRNVSPSLSGLKALGFRGLWGGSQGDAVSPSSPESNMRSRGGEEVCPLAFVIPANAGTQSQLRRRVRADWVPAFAGVTKEADAFHRKATSVFALDTMGSANIGTIRCR
jgi:hypothetical protein